MSLDVTLRLPGAGLPVEHAPQIFIREDGQTKAISRAEWDARYPGCEPVMVVDIHGETDVVYEANITHNLGPMALAADLYAWLWRPEECHVQTAKDLIAPLAAGLAKLTGNPEEFQVYNPANGWGDYDGLVCFTTAYLAACTQYPDALVEA